jgi:hypothetical protein
LPTVRGTSRESFSEVFALEDGDEVHLGLPVGVDGREHDAVRVGPVVVEALPDALGPFLDVGLGLASRKDLEVVVGAVAEDLRSARAEVGQPSDELLGRCGGRLLELQRRASVDA